MKPQYVTVGLVKRQASVRLKLRWDYSPETCQVLVDAMLPARAQVWHAKYANNEIYLLAKAPRVLPPMEWRTVYPAPGDLLFIPLPFGLPLPKVAPPVHRDRGLIDLAYFYDRANSLLNGPFGPLPGTIVATATSLEEVERMGIACNDVWFNGALEETMYIEVS